MSSARSTRWTRYTRDGIVPPMARRKSKRVGLPGVILMRLDVDAETDALMRRTLQRLNAACDWLAERAFMFQCGDDDVLRQRYYADLRAQFGLTAQMTIRVIGKVCADFKRDPTVQPHYRPLGAFPFDHKDLWTLPTGKPGHVSVGTLEGRRVVGYHVAEAHRALLADAARGRTQADLMLRRGRWYLAPTTRVPAPATLDVTGTLGVDLGVVNVAVDSDGLVFSGAEVERVRVHYAEQRKVLQRAKSARKQAKADARRGGLTARGVTRSLRRKLRSTAGKEAGFRRNENHRIAKRLVAKAQGTARRIALEDLSGIRERTTVRHAQRARHSSWSFFQLRAFIAHKAARRGVPVVFVDPRGTSTTCLQCRHRDRANRRSQSEFVCVRCGYAANADWLGAENIRLTADVWQPIVPREDREYPAMAPAMERPETPRSAGTSPAL